MEVQDRKVVVHVLRGHLESVTEMIRAREPEILDQIVLVEVERFETIDEMMKRQASKIEEMADRLLRNVEHFDIEDEVDPNTLTRPPRWENRQRQASLNQRAMWRAPVRRFQRGR